MSWQTMACRRSLNPGALKCSNKSNLATMSWVAPNDTPVLPDPGGSIVAGVYLLGDAGITGD